MSSIRERHHYEVLAQTHIRSRLSPLIELVEEMDSTYESVANAIADFPRSGAAAKVGLIIFFRLANDIRVSTWTAQLGYGLQALVTTGTVVELVGSLAYVGQSDARAAEWAEHTDGKHSYPRRVEDGIRATLAAFGVVDEGMVDNWREAYSFMCRAKHANPRLSMLHGLRIDPAGAYHVHGPDPSSLGLSMSAQALWPSVGFGTAGARIAAQHCRRDDLAAQVRDEAVRISDRLRAVEPWFLRVLDEATQELAREVGRPDA